MEQTILSHYKINNLDPNRWPENLDSDDSDDSEIIPGLNKRKSKSRYSALNRNATLRASVPGAERSKAGVENLVQTDEPDPLGGPQTVIQVLRQRGVLVEDDSRLRVLQTYYSMLHAHI